MLTVPTVKDHLHVPVIQVILGMDLTVQVSFAEGTSVCGVDANCTNSEGSFTCTCNTGYTWDGFNCAGEFCRRDLRLSCKC